MIIDKDPDAILDYAWDWTDWLAPVGDTIASINVVAVGVEVEATPAPSHDGQVVTIRASGGTAGSTGTLTCRITTTADRIDERTITLQILER